MSRRTLPLVVFGRKGFGDALNLRPVVEEVLRVRPDLYLRTPWPQLYDDLPVKLLPQHSGLTWSEVNRAAQPGEVWAPAPAQAIEMDLRYRWATLPHKSMLEQSAERARVRVHRYSLPPLPASPVLERDVGPIAVVRPVTGRQDWLSTARNPDPLYMRTAAMSLAAEGFHVVSVAAIGEAEPYLGEPLLAHSRFDHAQLTPLQLLALVQEASVVVAGPGWPIPAALAAGTPFVVLGGGAGGTNGPRALVPGWYRGAYQFVLPDRYCKCRYKEHTCDKRVANFAGRFTEALLALRVRSAYAEAR